MLKILWSRRWLIVVMAAVFAALGVVAALATGEAYVATARFRAPAIRAHADGSALFLCVARGPATAANALARLKPAERAQAAAGRPGVWRGLVRSVRSIAGMAPQQRSAAEALRECVQVSETAEPWVFDVRAVARTPELTAAATNAWVAGIEDALGRRFFVQISAAGLAGDTPAPPETGLAFLTKERYLLRIRGSRLEERARSLKSFLAECKGGSPALGTGHDTLERIGQDLHAALRRREKLAVDYGPKHPEMIAVERDIAQARRQAAAAARSLLDKTTREAASLDAEDKALAKRLQALGCGSRGPTVGERRPAEHASPSPAGQRRVSLTLGRMLGIAGLERVSKAEIADVRGASKKISVILGAAGAGVVIGALISLFLCARKGL